MLELALSAPARRVDVMPAAFTGAVFLSATLVFLVEPLVGKLLLPMLGGSPAVWNTSLAFFQAALLAGYIYAHLLQKIASVRTQGLIHLGVLLLAGLALPLRLSTVWGAPPPASPVLWLLGELTVSIGAPFAALSATAPLLQAWYIRLSKPEHGDTAYRLYAASNVGSLLALVAYPLVIEPHLTLSLQRSAWTAGYGAFALSVAGLVWLGMRGPAVAILRAAPSVPTAWRERLVWVGLAAVPSSLMLGVTSHLSSDVGSAPFLWVAPLALYLLSFVLAFQPRPVLSWSRLGPLHAVGLIAMLLTLMFPVGSWAPQLVVTLAGFFLISLVCHQALVARRPKPEALTEFYLLMSLGGMLGGLFNALLAPVLFTQVWEYPLALVAAAAARPMRVRGPLAWDEKAAGGLGLAASGSLLALSLLPEQPTIAVLACLCVGGGAALVLRDRGVRFVIVLGLFALAICVTARPPGTVEVRRSFFGVHRIVEADVPGAGRYVELVHGTTVHGAQAQSGPRRCTPATYYAEGAPIAQTVRVVQAGRPGARIGVVGLGTGALAAYSRPTDAVTFFEIDPVVLSLARDSGRFSYLTACAAGKIAYVLGDARLTMAAQSKGRFDLLVIDAFSSDTIPTHLLTREAMAGYFDKLAPGGVLMLHLSNRNLDLTRSAAATARQVGASVLAQEYRPAPGEEGEPVRSATRVLVAARSAAALAPFSADRRWRQVDSDGVRPWTDDYSDLLGALIAHLRHR